MSSTSSTSNQNHQYEPVFLPQRRMGTLFVHAGCESSPLTGAIVPSISLSTTFSQRGREEGEAGAGERGGLCKRGENDLDSWGRGYEYSRTGNPTRGAFERALALSENAQYGIAFASGLAATSAILSLIKSGDHVICIDDVYGGTQRCFRNISSPCSGNEFTFMDLGDASLIKASLLSHPRTKLIWCESPTNPTLKLSDIRMLAEVVKEEKQRREKEGIDGELLLVVDNTFMSPFLQNPLDLGADIVLHSVSKYISGHCDVIMGCLATNSPSLFDRLKYIQNSTGGVPSPFDCFLALRGLKTLHTRMPIAQSNALAIARFLESHACVESVVYPGLLSHKNHAIALSQTSGGGAMIALYIKGGLTHTTKFLASLKLFTLAESLGAVMSLAESPAVMTHASVPVEQRKLVGISDNLVRLSIGIEDKEDLIDDLDKALQAIKNI